MRNFSIEPSFYPKLAQDLSPVDRRLGAILIKAGKLIEADVVSVCEYKRDKPIRFGQAAIELGKITSTDLRAALAKQFGYGIISANTDKVSRELQIGVEPQGAEAERIRLIRSQLQVRGFAKQENPNTLAIVGVARGDGRSYVAASIAVAFAQIGKRTILVDADLRNPRQHEIFNVPNQSGLSTYLIGHTDSHPWSQLDSLPQLSVISAGPIPPNPQELLGGDLFADFLNDLKQTFDVVVIDTSAFEISLDAQLVASNAGTSLLVVRPHTTKMQHLEVLKANLVAAGTKIEGAVFNLHQ